MRKSLFATVAAAGALAAAVISPAVSNAVPGPPANTTVTFTIAAGDLNISAPATQPLTVSGLVASGGITPVVVTDQRRGIAGWITSAVSSAFTGPTAIPATAVTYTAGLPLLAQASGVVVATPASVTPINIGTTQPVYNGTLVVGNNTAGWTGTVNVALPSDVTAGAYSGTITHSVA